MSLINNHPVLYIIVFAFTQKYYIACMCPRPPSSESRYKTSLLPPHGILVLDLLNCLCGTGLGIGYPAIRP